MIIHRDRAWTFSRSLDFRGDWFVYHFALDRTDHRQPYRLDNKLSEQEVIEWIQKQ